MGLRYLPLEKQVEIEEVVDFNKFKFSIDERCAKKASISITHPYTYFKFNYKNEFVGLLIYNLVDESLDLNNIKSEDLMQRKLQFTAGTVSRIYFR
ncbi:MAG: hypothetical protein IPO48_11620 [Saprospiraceae bacterium]|nr:hypothetical protein [Saprospiraceae bacterium]